MFQAQYTYAAAFREKSRSLNNELSLMIAFTLWLNNQTNNDKKAKVKQYPIFQCML